MVLRSHVSEYSTFLGYYIVPTGKQLQKPKKWKTLNFNGILTYQNLITVNLVLCFYSYICGLIVAVWFSFQ